MTETITPPAAVFTDGALYFDSHGDVWRFIAEGVDGPEFLHVKRADDNTPDPSANRWCEAAESVARDFGPMRHLTDPLKPAHEALLLWALIGKDTFDDDVVHRVHVLIDMIRAEAAR